MVILINDLYFYTGFYIMLIEKIKNCMSNRRLITNMNKCELENKKITKEKVLNMFDDGYDCSQIVLSNVSDKLGITKETALKAAAAFGGGMWHGETCGCVVGALIALGIKYGNCVENDKITKEKCLNAILQTCPSETMSPQLQITNIFDK